MARHNKPGLEQVAGQVLQNCPTVPSTEQPTRQETVIVETMLTHSIIIFNTIYM